MSLLYASPGDPVEVDYLPDDPGVSRLAGNTTPIAPLVMPGLILYGLWLALLLSVFLEAMEP
jgi:hypothetical protein